MFITRQPILIQQIYSTAKRYTEKLSLICVCFFFIRSFSIKKIESNHYTYHGIRMYDFRLEFTWISGEKHQYEELTAKWRKRKPQFADRTKEKQKKNSKKFPLKHSERPHFTIDMKEKATASNIDCCYSLSYNNTAK